MANDPVVIDLGSDRFPPGNDGHRPSGWHSVWRHRRRWARAVVVALAVLVAAGAAEPAFVRVVGVLPDGTRYELRLPGGTGVGEVEGISAVVVWADGPMAGSAVGVTTFSSSDLYDALPVGRAVVRSGERGMVARAGRWAMLIGLDDYSMARRAELELIRVRERDGLIAVELPPSMRFGEPGELPVQMEVSYRHLRVTRSAGRTCAPYGKCSANGQVMVVATGEGVDTDTDADLSGIRVRVLQRA